VIGTRLLENVTDRLVDTRERVADAWAEQVVDRAVGARAAVAARAEALPGELPILAVALVIIVCGAAGTAVAGTLLGSPHDRTPAARPEARPAAPPPLAGVLRRLSSARLDARRALAAATTARGQARAARALSAAYATAATAAAARPSVAAGLRRAATAYTSLARAAHSVDMREFRRAAAAVRQAEAQLRSALAPPE